MLKLSKTQLNAVANKIYSEISTEISRKNKILVNATIIRFLKTDVGKAITKVNNAFFNRKVISDHTIESLAFEYFEVKRLSYPNVSLIANDIILASIDSTDLNALIESIKAKYDVQENNETA